MSATVISSDAAAAIMMTSSPAVDAAAAVTAAEAAAEVVFAACECCGLTEECTVAYVSRIRERFQGKWICGLCSEAVKDEIVRSKFRLITTEEAMSRHVGFCSKFRSPAPAPDPAIRLISALRQMLRKGSMSPKSMPCSPTRGGDGGGAPPLGRSESCMPSLTTMVETVVGFDDDLVVEEERDQNGA